MADSQAEYWRSLTSDVLRKENPRGSHESTLGTPRDQRSTDIQLLPPNIHFSSTLLPFPQLPLISCTLNHYFFIDPSSHHVRGHYRAMWSQFALKAVEAT